jgi:hypothetical protein
MARVEGDIMISRPVEEVFDFVADERNEPRYSPRMVHAEQLSAGPIGAGTRFRAELKARWGRSMPMTVEFIEFERPRRLTSNGRDARSTTGASDLGRAQALAGGQRGRFVSDLVDCRPWAWSIILIGFPELRIPRN